MNEHRSLLRHTIRGRVIGMYLLLSAFNIGAWIWAYTAFHGHPLLLSTGLLAYGFGLRHAVDADHIAAIDNVTRKLMQDGQRPVTIGFYFAIGHSLVVLLVAAAVAPTAAALESRVENWHDVGGVVSTLVSAIFLFLIATMNIAILRSLWKSFRKACRGDSCNADELDILLNNGGFWHGCSVRCSASFLAASGCYPSVSCSVLASIRQPR